MDNDDPAKSFSNPMDRALADAGDTGAFQSQPNQAITSPDNPIQAIQAAPMQDYGTTDFSQVNNAAPTPAETTTIAAEPAQPYVPQSSHLTSQMQEPIPVPVPQPQPVPQAQPNAYPMNQQIIPQEITPEFIASQPQSDAVFQPSPAPAPQLPNQINQNLAQATMQAAPLPPQPTIPQPGMPMSMGGIQPMQQQTQNTSLSHRSSSFAAYWPALAGGGVIIVILIVFLIVFL